MILDRDRRHYEPENVFEYEASGDAGAFGLDTCAGQLIRAEEVGDSKAAPKPHCYLSTAARRHLSTTAKLHLPNVHVWLSPVVLQYVLLERIWVHGTLLLVALLLVQILATVLRESIPLFVGEPDVSILREWLSPSFSPQTNRSLVALTTRQFKGGHHV